MVEPLVYPIKSKWSWPFNRLLECISGGNPSHVGWMETSSTLSPEDLDVSGSVEKGINNARVRDYIHPLGQSKAPPSPEFDVHFLSCTLIEFHMPGLPGNHTMWCSLCSFHMTVSLNLALFTWRSTVSDERFMFFVCLNAPDRNFAQSPVIL